MNRELSAPLRERHGSDCVKPLLDIAVRVWRYMSFPVQTARVDEPVAAARRRLSALGVFGLPVVTAGGRLAGVLSITDLLRAPEAGELRVDELMSPEPVAVSIDTAISAAAAAMVEHRVHRVFVTDGQRLAGVFSTSDVIRALAEQAAPQPIGELATPAHTIGLDAPLETAIAELDRHGASGLIGVEDGDWPVGVFTQRDALLALASGASRVGEAMVRGVICLPAHTRLDRAAAVAHRSGVRHVVAVHRRQMAGALTDMGFAGAVGG